MAAMIAVYVAFLFSILLQDTNKLTAILSASEKFDQ